MFSGLRQRVTLIPKTKAKYLQVCRQGDRGAIACLVKDKKEAIAFLSCFGAGGVWCASGARS